MAREPKVVRFWEPERANMPKDVQVTRITRLAVEGVSAQSLKEQIVRRIGAAATGC